MNRFVFLVLGFAVSLVALTTAGQAQNYPTKTIRIVVPYPAGGPTDLVGRTVADALTKALKKTVVVENKAGAGGTIGSDSVAKSAPDGHTLLLGLMGPMSIAPKISPNLPYDPLKDLAPIVLVADAPLVLVVPATSPFKSVADLVAAAKKRPGEITFASPGNGTVSHLTGELFQKWNFNAGLFSTSPAITITNTAAITMTAVYTNAPTPQTTNGLSFSGRVRILRN